MSDEHEKKPSEQLESPYLTNQEAANYLGISELPLQIMLSKDLQLKTFISKSRKLDLIQIGSTW